MQENREGSRVCSEIYRVWSSNQPNASTDAGLRPWGLNLLGSQPEEKVQTKSIIFPLGKVLLLPDTYQVLTKGAK